MKHDKNILNEITNQIDILNTVDGGVSMTYLKITKKENKIVISVKTPGVDKHCYQVELVNNTILIYSWIKITKNEVLVQAPSFIRNIPLPANTNSDEIYAYFENGKLKIIVPFNDHSKFKKRKLNIIYLS